MVYCRGNSANGDYCGTKIGLQWSTAQVVMMLGNTLASVTMYSKLLGMQNGFSVVYFEEYNAKGDYWASHHTVNHCIPQMNSQWSTAEGMMVLGTTLTFITMYSKLLQVQNGPQWSTA